MAPRTYPVLNPSRGVEIAQVVDSTAADVDAAVERAGAAARQWAAMAAPERAERLVAFSAAIDAISDELATLDAENSGNPIRAMRAGVANGAKTLRFFAGLLPRLVGETLPASSSHVHWTVREPYGVVGVITPFNHPSLYAAGRTAAALAAGNAVVLKPAHQTPLSAVRIGRLAEEHLLPGVYNVVTGGADAGTTLVSHPAVRRIGFTGSVRTALAISATAAASGVIKRLTFELGGKNPLVVLPDVDPSVAARAAVDGMNLTRVLGQSCGSTSRLFLHDEIYDRTIGLIRDLMERMRLGDPVDDAAELGCLVSEDQLNRVARYVDSAIAEGATVTVGGSRPSKPPFEGGFYYLPTLIEDVHPDMTVAREEIFGPVLSVMRWEHVDEVIDTINQSEYGLTASIYTNDLQQAMRLAREVQAGYVWINDVDKRWLGVPFGGQKNSGIGTEYSIEELYSFTQNKSVSIAL